MSASVNVPGQETQDGLGEDVVAIAGDHVSGTADIGELDLREAREEFVGAFLANQVAHLTANQKHGHAATQDRLNGGVHAIGIGDLKWRERRSAADELGIPMPIPTVPAAAQIRGQALQIGWPGPMRVVFGDGVGDFF